MLLSWGESLFTWSDETDVDFTNWDQDEPNGAVSEKSNKPNGGSVGQQSITPPL